MPPLTRTTPPGPSNAVQRSKHTMSDAESAPQHPKKARRNSSAEPSTRRDPNRDTKRRRRRKKKAPVVSPPAKSDAMQSRPDERTRTPLSARNEIIRFASVPSEAGVPATQYFPQASSSKMPGQSREGSSRAPAKQSMPSTLNDKERVVLTVTSPPGSSSGSLEEKVAQLEAELKSKNNLIASHQALLNQVQQAITCQVCLDLMYKPYALAPCGHLACHSCLVNWFTAPPPDNRPAVPATMRRKTCPHCRAVVRERPVEVWGVKGITLATGKSGLLPNQLPVPDEPPESLNANADPWKNIFPKPGAGGRRGFSWFIPGADIDDDDAHIADIAPRGEDVGMLDMEDGGIYRCLDCMHEIWDGVCTSCGRVYPGHRAEGEDDGEDAVGWLEDQMGAEEVDVAADPGWMGLEDGQADDDGDVDDWRPFPPWRRRLHGGPWGFLGAIHVHEEDEEDTYGQVDDLRVADEDEGSEEEGYESSFIDDNDEGDGPRIYEIGDDDDDYRSRIVDLGSDDGNEHSDAPRYGGLAISSDEESAPHFAESNGYWSDG